MSDVTRPNLTPRPRPVSQLAISAARWPPAAALIALLVLGAVFPEKYGLLPKWASGPLWLLVLVLIGLSTFAHASPVLRRLEGPTTFGLLAIVTGLLVYDVMRLVHLVLAEGSQVRGVPLLSTGATLWASNSIIFGLWYWQLDRGGPERRGTGDEAAPDLRFPVDSDAGGPPWTPQFFDYVFVAFNTSIAFSPTDTSPATTRAKVLMMTQALLSLITLVIVVARAVNILD